MLKVLEHILLTWPALEPEYRAYNDAIKDLQGESMIELQRLASEMPDHLLVSCLPNHRKGRILMFCRRSTIQSNNESTR